jgi:hypothetical protein
VNDGVRVSYCFCLFLRFVNIVTGMKKFLLALSSVFLFAASLSAQTTSPSLTAAGVLPNNLSVFGKDIVSTLKFDSVHTKLNQPFDSANHSFVADTFDGHGGAFIFDTTNSVHSNMLFTTNDGSGFVIMDSEAMGDDTQRVTLTSPAFNTNNLNTLKVMLNHHYKYSVNDSAANLLISTNGTTWNLVESFSAAAADRGTSTAFVTDTFILGSQYLNKNTVYLRLVYATDSGYQWAVNNLKVIGDAYDYTYSFFRRPMPANMSNPVEWDLSDAVYDGNFKYYVRKPAPAPYRFIDSIYNEELGNLIHTTYSQNYFTATGIIAQAGLTYQQRIPLESVTGSVSDSLAIPTQFVLPYSSLHTKTRYPMTFNFANPSASTKWSSDFRFKDSIFLVGFNLSPQFISAIRDVHIIEKDTLIGWGRMKLIADNSSYQDVWQVAVSYKQIDTFYCINTDSTRKAVFNNFMTTYSGISNPLVQDYRMIHYYREKSIHPFVTVYMHDTTVFKIEAHIAQPWPTELAAIETATNDIAVYPNPVTDHLVHVSIDKPENGTWNCDILNTVGQYLGSQQLNVDNTKNNDIVKLPATLASGLYYLHISKNGQTVTVKPIQVQ